MSTRSKTERKVFTEEELEREMKRREFIRGINPTLEPKEDRETVPTRHAVQFDNTRPSSRTMYLNNQVPIHPRVKIKFEDEVPPKVIHGPQNVELKNPIPSVDDDWLRDRNMTREQFEEYHTRTVHSDEVKPTQAKLETTNSLLASVRDYLKTLVSEKKE